MKLLLMADNYVGEKVTNWLIEHHKEDIILVVSTSENEIFSSAFESKIPCIVFESIHRTRKYLSKNKIEPDLGFLVWWPHIVKKPLLDYPKFGFINTHPSHLPLNRGKHPNFWAIVEEVSFGVTLHFVEEALDSGDIVAQNIISYDWEDTGKTLYYKSLDETIELFKKMYPRIREFNIPRYSQNNNKSTFHFAKEINEASNIQLDRIYSARHLLNLLRARTFSGHPACWFEDNNQKYEVRIEVKRKI